MDIRQAPVPCPRSWWSEAWYKVCVGMEKLVQQVERTGQVFGERIFHPPILPFVSRNNPQMGRRVLTEHEEQVFRPVTGKPTSHIESLGGVPAPAPDPSANPRRHRVGLSSWIPATPVGDVGSHLAPIQSWLLWTSEEQISAWKLAAFFGLSASRTNQK